MSGVQIPYLPPSFQKGVPNGAPFLIGKVSFGLEPSPCAALNEACRVISSVGRASRLHRECREVESLITHHEIKAVRDEGDATDLGYSSAILRFRSAAKYSAI